MIVMDNYIITVIISTYNRQEAIMELVHCCIACYEEKLLVWLPKKGK